MRALLTDREISFLEALVEGDVAFMVVGMSAAILQGVPGVTQDIDLWVGPGQGEKMARACARAGAVCAWRISPPVVAGPGLGSFDLVWRCDGLGSFDEEIARGVELCEVSPGLLVPVLPLERVAASKEAADRPKDRAVLPVLRDVLKISKRGG